jgi:hypothetical protein
MTFDPVGTGIRVLDIEHGLRQIQPTGLTESELGNTLLLGKAANLGLHLRDLNVVRIEPLQYMAAELGIRRTELDTVLRELEELGWARVAGAGASRRVEVLVPALRPGFEDIGERWKVLGPTEIEQASVSALSDAVLRPFPKRDLKTRLGLDDGIAAIVIEVGDTGTYLRTYRLNDGQELLYSPLYGDTNPEKAYQLVKQHGDKPLIELIQKVQGLQGIPIDSFDRKNSLLREAILAGLLLGPAVKDKQFLFTAQHGTEPEEAIILDKARALLSCVRYGEHFAGITRIFDPAAILRALLHRKKLQPHSEHAEQYGLLVVQGIGRIDTVGSKYQFSILDTPDNLKAVRTALQILNSGTGVDQGVDDAISSRALSPGGSYRSPVLERAKLNRSPKLGKASDAKAVQTISQLAELIRGARSSG